MQFQTESIINSASSVKLITVGSKKGVAFGPGKIYMTEDILDANVTQTNPVAGTGGSAAINLATIKTSMQAKPCYADIYVNSDIQFNSNFEQYSVQKGRDVSFEFFGSTVNEVVANFERGLKTVLDSNECHVNVTKTSDSFSVSLVDPYLSFSKFDIQVFEAHEPDSPSYGKFKTIKSATITANEKPFGTSKWLEDNLRLPTLFASRFEATNKHEKPIDGENYIQLFLQMNVERDIYGMGAVGQLVTSKTEHIFYIKEDQFAAVQAILKSADIKIDGVLIP